MSSEATLLIYLPQVTTDADGYEEHHWNTWVVPMNELEGSMRFILSQHPRAQMFAYLDRQVVARTACLPVDA